MHVEIWSDIACPWCFVGKRRFETALAEFEHRDEVQVTWRSFELDPTAPLEYEGELAAHLAEKYGMTIAEARERQQHLVDLGRAEGEELRFDLARRARTFDGHRLVHLAEAHGLQDEMKERLLRAYFTEGKLISDHDTLTALGIEVGLPEDGVREMLGGERYADAVRDDERTAQQLGISAVPTFVVDRALAASGAHPPDALLGLLRQGWEAPSQERAAGRSG
ncbi:MAG TPA: DsbA family oxidoreductase [Solirubrobacteraceae bacterium]|nr:DsbA family oxidoreductase [Solirubrobacteraceae bacterium]